MAVPRTPSRYKWVVEPHQGPLLSAVDLTNDSGGGGRGGSAVPRSSNATIEFRLLESDARSRKLRTTLDDIVIKFEALVCAYCTTKRKPEIPIPIAMPSSRLLPVPMIAPNVASTITYLRGME